MNRWCPLPVLILICLFALPSRSPAPLIYRPGEGWTYESPGKEGKWQRSRAKDQLEVADQALEQKNFSVARRAAQRVVKQWPLSDYAPRAQYLVGRCYEASHYDEKAFKEYQKVLEKYPKIENYQEILQRQYDIATRFLAGQRFRLWGYIPLFRSMDRTADMYEKVIKDGPYSEVAPKAQLNIGTAHEKKSDYPLAVKAYERAADRYNDKKEVAADALFKAGLAYQKQAQTADYDQSVASQAIATLSDFATLYPDDPRVPEAHRVIATLKAEQASGSFKVAQFYEKNRRWNGALIYYNEVLLKDPESKLAAEARQRIDVLKNRVAKK
jgi:outer membrane protein assembly factor BamD